MTILKRRVSCFLVVVFVINMMLFSLQPEAYVKKSNVQRTNMTTRKTVASKVVLNSIAIVKPAKKLIYTVGEHLDINGLVIVGSYSNGTKRYERLTTKAVTGFNSSKPIKSQTLTINIGGKKTSFKVKIISPVLKSISIRRLPRKLKYSVGETLDLAGLLVMGSYNNGMTKQEKVSENSIMGFDSSEPTKGQTLTILIGSVSVKFQINIEAPVLNKINIVSQPTKRVFYVGENLDISGIRVVGTYSDGTTKEEAVAPLDVSGFNSQTPAASQTLTITIDGKTVTYTVEIKEADLSSIAITSQATKKVYYVGDRLDLAGLVVTGTYDNGTSKIETVTQSNVSGFNSESQNSSQTLTISIGGKTASYTIEIKEVELSSIAITSQATKKVYYVGDRLDLAGLIVTGTYDNGTSKIETVTQSNVTGFNSESQNSSQTLTISIGEKTASYTIEIKAIEVSSIEITAQATKKIYSVGESLDLTGLVVTGTYNNGMTKVESVQPSNVTGFNSTTPMENQTLTITISGKTTTYSIEIKAPVPVVIVPYLNSIAITTHATKRVYYVGESLDITGLVVNGTYSNGSTKVEIIKPSNITGFDSTAPVASQTLTVTVGGKATTYTVEIKAVVLDSIAITSQASKKVYYVGDLLDITGLAVTGTYNNGATKVENVQASDVTGFNSAAPVASQILTVTLGGKTATYTIEVKTVVLDNIAITAQATKKVYYVGDALDLTGLEVTGTYNNGTTKVESVLHANIAGFDSTAPVASQTLTITVGGKTAAYTIEVKAVSLDSIAITVQASKKVYYVGDLLDITGLTVTGTYNNGTTKVESVQLSNIAGFDSTAPDASQTLTVSVSGKTTTYMIEVKAVVLNSIAITTQATKKIYYVGDALDITGLIVTGTYNNGTTKAENVQASDVTDFDSTVPDASQTLTITVSGKIATYTIEVKAVVLDSIAITTQATKKIYYAGDALDITGLEVTGTYNNGTTKVENVQASDVTGFDSTAPAASQTLTVTVGEKTTTYTIEIKSVVLDSIAITAQASKKVYYVGDLLDITGLAVTGTYNNGTTKAESVQLANIAGFDSTAPAASQTLTITVGGKIATYTIEVKAVILDSIAITTQATKKVYYVGEALNLTGLAVTGTYNNGTTKVESVLLANIAGFDSTAPAVSQTLTITVGGKTATYTIEIKAVLLDSIAITSQASKKIYYVGDLLDITGLTVTGTYNNGTTKVENVLVADVTGFSSTAPAASQTLTITVGGKTAIYTIEIKAVVLVSIAITAQASNKIYYVGDLLDITGLAVTGTYSNGTTKVENVQLSDITGFDSTVPAASQTLTITVGEKTATYTIQVKVLVPSLYVSDYTNNSIIELALDGSENRVVVEQIDGNMDSGPMAIVATSTKIYWAGQDSKKIECSDLSGANRRTIIADTGSSNISALTVDEVNGKIYWADYSANIINSADLQSPVITNVVTSVDSIDGGPRGLTLSNGILYWINESMAVIDSYNLSSKTRSSIIATGALPQSVNSIAIDAVNGKLYWNDYMANNIKVTDLANPVAGSVAVSNGDKGTEFIGVEAILYHNGYLYWICDSNGEIRRAKVNGMEEERINLPSAPASRNAMTKY